MLEFKVFLVKRISRAYSAEVMSDGVEIEGSEGWADAPDTWEKFEVELYDAGREVGRRDYPITSTEEIEGDHYKNDAAEVLEKIRADYPAGEFENFEW